MPRPALARRVYPRFRLVNYDPLIIETERGYVSVEDSSLAKLVLIVAHTPGSDVEKVVWAYAVATEAEDVDAVIEEAHELLEELARRKLILVV